MRRVAVLSARILLTASLGLGCAGQVGGSSDADDPDDPSDDDGSEDPGSNGSGGSMVPPTKTPDGKPLRVRNENLGLQCAANTEPVGSPLLRLTNREYENTLRSLFGTLPNAPSLPAESQFDGYRSNVEAQAPSEVLIESLSETADALAAVAFDKVVTCKPADAAAERACLDGMLDGFGRKLFRRPLTDAEKTRFRTFFSEERATDDFRTSMVTLLSGLMQSPQFLYRVELGRGTGARRSLTGSELASRLSYLIWDDMPDEALMAAAERGELDDAQGLGREVDRLVADPRAKAALGDFAQQWLAFAKLADATQVDRKDRMLFTKYNEKTTAALAEGLSRFVDQALWADGGGIKTLLTDARAFVSADTAWIYGATAPAGGMGPVDVDATRRVGVLGQAGFLAGTAHERLTGPILRGAFVLDHFLCSSPPPPPPDVNQDVVKAGSSDGLTNRERVETSHQVGACAACHRIIDPVGFTMEHFDAVGAWQDRDNGKPVDATGRLENTFDADGTLDGLPSLASKLAGSEQVAECVSANWLRYGLGRSLGEGDGCELASVTEEVLSTKGWSTTKLITALAKSPTFRTRIVEAP